MTACVSQASRATRDDGAIRAALEITRRHALPRHRTPASPRHRAGLLPAWPTGVLLLVLLAAPPVSVYAQAGLLVPGGSARPDPSVLSLREMAVDVGLARGYARVAVRQVFENHTNRIQEGIYRFRLPPSAAVGDFAVWDGLRRIPGVILEKQRARAIYRELTTQKIDPGLLQQGDEDDTGAPGEAPAHPAAPSGGALFSVRVAPIPALGTKRLELQFQQEVPFLEGRGEFRLALRPNDGEAPVARTLRVRVRVLDGTLVPDGAALALVKDAQGDHVFEGRDVKLERDIVVRLAAKGLPELRVSAFRNPSGELPMELALAPWERPSEIPPEQDGFFLLEGFPAPGSTAPTPGAARERATARPPLTLAILFDTSLTHRFTGLERAYEQLVQVLERLTPKDRFVLVPFDAKPAAAAAAPQFATRAQIEAALQTLRSQPLGLGQDIAKAVEAGARAVGAQGRLLLLTAGAPGLSSKALGEARGGLPLFTALTGEEAPEALRNASAQVLVPGATTVEEDLFFLRLLEPAEKPAEKRTASRGGWPVQVSGGEPQLRDIYPVLVQPLAPGSLSGWIGRYARPQPRLTFAWPAPLFAGGQAKVDAALPELALDARDLPRRWARARVDYLLARIEAEGERREWVDEIIALSKRYTFVTPYTAFLAAPRSLLRPRRIQPGDPVLRVECDAGIQAAVALFPFGLRLPLERRPGTNLFEGRFLVPEGLRDGRYEVRILLRDASGAHATETKSFVLDGRAPQLAPELLTAARAGQPLRLAVRTDEDVIVLRARLGDGSPVPLRWDAAARRSLGTLNVPAGVSGPQTLFFEAVDGAKNHAFARLAVEVKP
jgi:Ca-activated chloride channel family protein